MKTKIFQLTLFVILSTTNSMAIAQSSGGVWGALQGVVDSAITEIKGKADDIKNVINNITDDKVTLPIDLKKADEENKGDPVVVGKSNDYTKIVHDADNNTLMTSMPNDLVTFDDNGECNGRCNVQCTMVVPPAPPVTFTTPAPVGVRTEIWLTDFFLEVVRHRGTSTMPNLRSSLKDIKSGNRSAGAGADQGFYHVHIFPKFLTAAGTLAGLANGTCHMPAVAVQSPYISELDAYWSPGNSDTPLVKFTTQAGDVVGSLVGDKELGGSFGGAIGNTLIYLIQLGTTVDQTSLTSLAGFLTLIPALIADQPAAVKAIVESLGYYHMATQALSMEECVALSVSKKADSQNWNMGSAGCQGAIGALNGYVKGEPAVVASLLAQRALTLMHARWFPTLPSTAAGFLGLVPSVQWFGASRDSGLCSATDGTPGRVAGVGPGLQKTDYKLWMLHPVADKQPKRLGESPYLETGSNLFKQILNLTVEKQKKNPPQGADYVFMVLKKRVCCAGTWEFMRATVCNVDARAL